MKKANQTKQLVKRNHRRPHLWLFQQSCWLAVIKPRPESDPDCCKKGTFRRTVQHFFQVSPPKQKRTMADSGLRDHTCIIYIRECFSSHICSVTLPLRLWFGKRTHTEIKTHCPTGGKLLRKYNRNPLLVTKAFPVSLIDKGNTDKEKHNRNCILDPGMIILKVILILSP